MSHPQLQYFRRPSHLAAVARPSRAPWLINAKHATSSVSICRASTLKKRSEVHNGYFKTELQVGASVDHRPALPRITDSFLRTIIAFSQGVWPSFLTSPHTVAVVGAPGQFGQPLAGTDKGPQLLREAGLHKSLAALGWRVEEMGDVVRKCL